MRGFRESDFCKQCLGSDYQGDKVAIADFSNTGDRMIADAARDCLQPSMGFTINLLMMAAITTESVTASTAQIGPADGNSVAVNAKIGQWQR
jgi:hypothetical protein